ncbi:hypothetical protein ABTY96_12315 [Streptomyces sp. NPDC096057]|uniref:hypothetical protein n=1 Tax=Streptomyces sp. NPDC096057 TaxID=3155543 RepID=UPI00332704D1
MSVPSYVLGGLPEALRAELVGALENITRNFSEGRWEPSELNGGKLCEIVYSIVRGYADGQFPQQSSKPANMVRECQKLEQETQLPRSLRIQVPRMLIALYEIRNNRGVGHVGSDVDPNHMDAVAVLYMSKWIIAELIRVFHDVDTATASESVDSLVERQLEIVWNVDGKKRVLSEKLSLHDKTLLLLYSEPSPVSEKDLLMWAEAANASSYRRDILKKCHKARLIEYDDVARTARLSPKGARYVEENISLSVP